MRQRTTIAVLVEDGLVKTFATNEHKEPCKRVGYPTGEGYELCEWCNYPNHAEYKAVQGQKGGTLYLIGHTYACEPCKLAASSNGIQIQVII